MPRIRVLITYPRTPACFREAEAQDPENVTVLL